MEVIRHASLASLFAVLVSATPMVMGIAFAVRPNERWLALMRPLSLAGIFAAVSNVFLGLANALRALTPANPDDPVRLGLATLVLAEASVLPFLAFACLTAGWLGVAIGMRKQY